LDRMRATSVIASAIVMVMLGAGFGNVISNAGAAQSGGDSYGYAYTDSKSPEPSVTFSWVDITATGTPLPIYGDNAHGGPYPIGFDFYFYGERYSMLNVSTNGFITFGPGSSANYNNPVPYPYDFNNIIAPFWDDLYVRPDEIVVDVLGVEPDRRFVLEWVGVERVGYSGFPMTFEIMLDESSNDMWFQYDDLSGMTGDSATVGIENSDGTDGVQYGFDHPVLENGLAIKFSRLPVVITPSQTSSVHLGAVATYNLKVLNLQPFSDTLDITFVSVEGWPVSILDEYMLPLADTDSDSMPDVGELPAYSAASIVVTVEVPSSPTGPSETTTVTACSSVDPLVSSFCTLTTSVSSVWFDPPHTDYGYDYDDDGLYDMLIVEVSVNSTVSGVFEVRGYLKTYLGGTIHVDSVRRYLDAIGSWIFELEFNGHLIRETGIDGPYSVALILYDASWTEMGSAVYETAAYAHTEFEEFQGEFLLPFIDEAVDEDLDGFYDYLEVEIPLEVSQAGWFYLQADLFDSIWGWIDGAHGEEYFEVGQHAFTFRYDPWAIWTKAYDGEFNVEASLYGQYMDLRMQLDYHTHTTSAYEAAIFERPPAVFAPPHSERVVDDDEDLLWDALVVEAGVDVAIEGDYVVQGRLLNTVNVIEEVVTVRSHLSEGAQTVELSFPGFLIWYYGRDGPHFVALEVEGYGRLLDRDSYTTHSYSYTEFEHDIADFIPSHRSEVVDSDEDGLYDYLLTEVLLSVTVPGTYKVVARLYTPSMSPIGTSRVTAYLGAGPALVDVTFSGCLLRNRYESGSFYMDLYLYDSSGRIVVYGSHTTAFYDYLDFEDWPAAFWRPHEGYASDDDHDSLYDRYVANLTVEVYSAGTYYISGAVWDEGHSKIASSGIWETLDEGIHVVQVSFPGWIIYANGYSTEYSILARLFDSRMNEISLTGFETGALDHEAFDPTRPAIESRVAVSPPVVDGVIGASEWSDAVVVQLDGISEVEGMKASLMVMNDAEALYVCVDAYGDTVRNLDDSAGLAFDTGNDGMMTSGHEDIFAMFGEFLTEHLHMTYSEYYLTWRTHCAPFEEDGLMGAVGFVASAGHPEEHKVYEFRIPLTLLGVPPGGSIGFALGVVYDTSTGHLNAWPSPVFSGDTLVYGDLLLAEYDVVTSPVTTASVEGTVGLNGWYLSGVNVTLTATGGEGGVDYTEYRLDGGSWTNNVAPISIQLEGAHMLEYRSVDNTANVEPTKIFIVKIDRVAPITTSAVSGSRAWLNATDATSGLAITMYRIDGGTWKAYLGTLDISDEGTHTVEFYSTDLAGNVEETQSLELEVEEEGGGGILADMNFYMVLAIIAIIVLISIGAIFGMRRRAKESDSKAAIKDIGTTYSQMMMEEPPKPPDKGK
jgi:hypothetical protein